MKLLGFEIMVISIAIMTFFSLYVAYIGPTSAERVIAVNVITVKVTVIITLLAVILKQEKFIDVALIYGMMGYMATVVPAKLTVNVAKDGFIIDKTIGDTYQKK